MSRRVPASTRGSIGSPAASAEGATWSRKRWERSSTRREAGSSSSPSRSTTRTPARFRYGSWRAACVTATSGRGTTGTGACRSRCCSATRARGSSNGSAPASKVCGSATASSCRGPSPAGRAGRASAGSPGDVRTRGPSRRGSGEARDGAPLSGVLACGTLATQDRGARRAGHPAPRRHPARQGVPPGMRRLDRRRGGDPDREGLAGRDRRGDRSRRHRPRRDAGSEDRGRGASDRDRHRVRQARVGRHVRRDGRRRCLIGRPGPSGARADRRSGGRLRVRGDRDPGVRRSGRGDARVRRNGGRDRRSRPSRARSSCRGAAPNARRIPTRPACSSRTAGTRSPPRTSRRWPIGTWTDDSTSTTW